MKSLKLLGAIALLFLMQTANGQSLIDYQNRLDDLMSPELVKRYSQNHEMDHYINGAGTKYAESQFFWYPDDENTYMVKLYGLKAEVSENPLEVFQSRVRKGGDEVYKYELAESIGDYAYWVTSKMEEASATTTDATLKVLLKKESFVVQVDMGSYEKSQEVAMELALEVVRKCR